MSVPEFDYIIIGSGINSLVCGALLSKQGAKIAILEREKVAGGCIKSGEVTLPGFKHDLMSGFYPEFIASPAYAALSSDLAAHGLEFVNTEYPTGAILPGGKNLILKTNREDNKRAFNAAANGDGEIFAKDLDDFAQSAHLSFGLLGNEVLSFSTAKMLFNELRMAGLPSMVNFFGKAARSARSWVSAYQSEEARALLAPWILHAGMDLDGAMSGYMGRVFAFALEAAGMPVVKGGSENLVTAFTKLIEGYGGVVITSCDVQSIDVANALANSVLSCDGRRFHARKGVICNVTPTQLYGDNGLIPSDCVSTELKREVSSFRYGRGNMIIHYALDEAPNWPNADLKKVAMLHISDGLHQTTQSLTDAKNGLLPERATLAVGQKCAVDPSRAPAGKSDLWIQLHEIPRVLKGDAAGLISTENGWDDDVKKAYADRIHAQLEEFAPGLDKITLGRAISSPADLEKMNINLVGGDPYSGENTLDQFLLWRPLRSIRGRRTPIKNVFHIGASTHPGPGLGGGSGYLAARRLS